MRKPRQWSSPKYPKIVSDEGFELEFKRGRSEILKFACCDCALVHRMAFAIEKNGKLGVAMMRDNRATAALRRKKRKR